MKEGETDYYTLVQKAFDRLAPVYNVVALPLAGVREKVVDFAKAREGAHILDVATGTGQQAFAFARRGYRVTGVDLNAAMLAIARKKDKNGLVAFEAGDATRLRFEDNRFDVACVSFALHDMPAGIRDRVLKEMARVTKPTGLLVVVDYALPRSRPGRSLVYRLVSLYEGEYYSGYIHSDLEASLGAAGVEITGKQTILLGAGQIWKGIKGKGYSHE